MRISTTALMGRTEGNSAMCVHNSLIVYTSNTSGRIGNYCSLFFSWINNYCSINSMYNFRFLRYEVITSYEHFFFAAIVAMISCLP